MKKLLTALAALLSVAAPASAQREPAQNTAKYYYLSGDTTVLMLMSSDISVSGSHRYVWLLNVPHTKVQYRNLPYDLVWVLVDADCENNTTRFVRTELEGNVGKVVSAGPTNPVAVAANSPAKLVADAVCHNTGDAERVVTSEQVVNAIMMYRSINSN